MNLRFTTRMRVSNDNSKQTLPHLRSVFQAISGKPGTKNIIKTDCNAAKRLITRKCRAGFL